MAMKHVSNVDKYVIALNFILRRGVENRQLAFFFNMADTNRK